MPEIPQGVTREELRDVATARAKKEAESAMDIIDRLGDIMDKCNDIFEKVNE